MGKPKIKRRLLCGALGLGLAGIFSGGALAAPPSPPWESAPKGKTSVGVQTADLAPDSLSFTVPLYLTVAASRGADGPEVVVPTNYSLTNTTGSAPDGHYPDIAVTDVKVQAVAGGTWSLRANPAADKQIMLSIGGLVLPDVNAGDTSVQAAAIRDSENSFYDFVNRKFKLLPSGPSAQAVYLPIAGALPAGFNPTDEKAAAQFRVKYTVSLLDAGGEPIGVSYVGPSKDQAAAPEPGGH